LTIEQKFYILSLVNNHGGIRAESHVGKKQRRRDKLELTVASLQQRYGARAAFRGRSPAASFPTPTSSHISTGFSQLDEALNGGLPKGRISEWVGQPTSGKTTLALKFLEQAQQQLKQVGYIDQARYFDPDYAHRCGIDLSRLLIGTPYDPAETLAMAEALVRDGGLAALVLDTLDFMWADTQTTHLLNASLGRLLKPLAQSGTALLFLHDPLGAESSSLSILAHYASVRLDVMRERWQTEHGDIRGYEARIKVLKNRFGPPGRETKISITFNGTIRGDGL